jgi:chemotaxis protein methyltransferase CheR
MTAPALSPSLFRILSRLVEERTGLHYAAGDQDIFSTKLLARAHEAGFDSPLDYYYFLRYDDRERREFDELVEALVVNETYFFREADALRFLCDDVLRPAVAKGRRPRVWCAACSTGEEPLTLAMLLADKELLGHVEIVASDISRRALERATAGVYGPRSLRAVTGEARWFDVSPVDDGKRRVRSEIRAAVKWHRVNLFDADAVAALGGHFDVILCRNVLIYFDEDTIRAVVARLAGSLRDGGLLLVGASESLMRFGTVLTCEERGGSFFYRKASW